MTLDEFIRIPEWKGNFNQEIVDMTSFRVRWIRDSFKIINETIDLPGFTLGKFKDFNNYSFVAILDGGELHFFKPHRENLNVLDLEFVPTSQGLYRTTQKILDIFHNPKDIPTLTELFQAYCTSQEFRRDIWGREYGEWTSSFLLDGKELIERPEKLIHHPKYGFQVEGGKRTKVELPPKGCAVAYDKLTGLPTKTTKGDGTYYSTCGNWLTYDGNGLEFIKRLSKRYNSFPGGHFGPFKISAHSNPKGPEEYYFFRSGVRSIIRER